MTCPLEHPSGCGWCGKPLPPRRTRWCSTKCSRTFTANHRWTQAKALAKSKVILFRCANCEEAVADVEVNHIVPCRGKHGTWGCHHHQDNLEVLCRPCHLAVTAQQRKEGLI